MLVLSERLVSAMTDRVSVPLHRLSVGDEFTHDDIKHGIISEMLDGYGFCRCVVTHEDGRTRTEEWSLRVCVEPVDLTR